MAEYADNFMSRSSTQTDESPFPSGLTTPVDEDHILFGHSILAMQRDGSVSSLFTRLDNYGGSNLGTPKVKPTDIDGGTKETKAPPADFANFLLDDISISPVSEPSPVFNQGQSMNNLYNMPNKHVKLREGELSFDSIQISSSFGSHGTNSGSNIASIARGDSLTDPVREPGNPAVDEALSKEAERECAELEAFCDLPAEATTVERLTKCSVADLNMSSVFVLVLKIALFVPWCVAVGALILAFPQHLERITFGTGYAESRKGIHRFVFWGDCAMHLVGISLGFVALTVWYNKPVGLTAFLGLVTLFLNAWRDFAVDYTVALGEDDRQTLYLLATKFAVDDAVPTLKRTSGRFFVDLGVPETVVSAH